MTKTKEKPLIGIDGLLLWLIVICLLTPIFHVVSFVLDVPEASSSVTEWVILIGILGIIYSGASLFAGIALLNIDRDSPRKARTAFVVALMATVATAVVLFAKIKPDNYSIGFTEILFIIYLAKSKRVDNTYRKNLQVARKMGIPWEKITIISLTILGIVLAMYALVINGLL